MNSQLTRVESSQKLATDYAMLQTKLGETITPAFLTTQLERLQAVWGVPRDRTAEQVVLMVREWFDALSGFGGLVVRKAFDHVISFHSYGWTNALPIVVDRCMRETRAWMDIYARRTPDALPAPEVHTDDDLAKRAADCLRWRKEHPGVFTPEACDGNQKSEARLASQSQRVSPALEAIARKRGYWHGKETNDEP